MDPLRLLGMAVALRQGSKVTEILGYVTYALLVLQSLIYGKLDNLLIIDSISDSLSISIFLLTTLLLPFVLVRIFYPYIVHTFVNTLRAPIYGI
jgi:fucose 4-O-acetylase-like acetyltransferase